MKDSVALITGASRGLGAATARMLLDSGMRVGINYLADDEAAASVAKGFEDALLLKADVSDPVAVKEMASRLKEKWGRLDLLVNNAGVSEDALLMKTTEDAWQRAINVNLKAAFNTTKAFGQLIKNSGGGHIINVTSRSGIYGKQGQAAYSASKAALIGLTMTSAKELGRWNIRVNALAPGYMPTDMGAAAREAMQAAKERSLLGILGSEYEAASFVLWLMGTTTITGQVFSLDTRLG